MTWDFKHTVLAALAATGIAGAGLAYRSWLGAHDALLRAQAAARVERQTLAQAARASRQIAAAEKRRDAQMARQIAVLRAQAAKQQTSGQIAAWLPKQIPTPRPIRIQIPEPAPKNPAPAAVATIPQADLAPLRDFVASCQACSLRLHAARQDLAAKDAQLQLAGKQLTAALKERDAALQAAKGGGFWRRLASACKWFAVGAGAGAALLCASGHCR